MSPEQARGNPLDARSDIWSFGCVLYEMLTGRRAFAGDDVTDVLASILAREPDLAALPAGTPPPIRRLLRRCLEKDRTERLHDIADARLEIADAMGRVDPDVNGDRAGAPGRRTGERLAWIGALTAAGAGAGRVVDAGLPPARLRRRDARGHRHAADDRAAVAGAFSRRTDDRVCRHGGRTRAVVAALAGNRSVAADRRDRRRGVSVLVARQPGGRLLCRRQAQARRRRRRIGADDCDRVERRRGHVEPRQRDPVCVAGQSHLPRCRHRRRTGRAIGADAPRQ